jgi:lysophospholipase L1-like esterase
MLVFKYLSYVLVVCLTGIVIGGCEVIDKVTSTTSPSPVAAATPGPPGPNAAVHYAAIGASDANGVGSSVQCAPFTACENGTGYVPTLVRQLRTSREVTATNFGIPASVLSPAIEAVARQYDRDVTGNFVDRQMPFVPRNATLVTIFGGGNDTNVVGHAIERGAGAGNIPAYIDTQARAFGADYDRLVRGVRERAPGAFIIILNLPNLAVMPYAARHPTQHKQVLQAISVAFSREANRQAGPGVTIMDLMCDPGAYNPAHVAADGFHPSDAGHAYMAARLAEIVNGAPSTPAASCSQMSVF